MDDNQPSNLDSLLDLLADEVAARLASRSKTSGARATPQAADVSAVVLPSEPSPAHVPPREPLDALPVPPVPPLTRAEPLPPLDVEKPSTSTPVPQIAAPVASHAASLMLRLAVGVFLAVVLINIPYNLQGTALARSIPNSASLVIANGLLVKEASSTDVYVYRDDAFHWITSLDAFEHFGYRWQNVHIVEDGFLKQFVKGRPVYVLLKCDGSPHIYRLENGQKRWIVDIPTFIAEGHVWEDVRFLSCADLRALPDGNSIPSGRGAPPSP